MYNLVIGGYKFQQPRLPVFELIISAGKPFCVTLSVNPSHPGSCNMYNVMQKIKIQCGHKSITAWGMSIYICFEFRKDICFLLKYSFPLTEACAPMPWAACWDISQHSAKSTTLLWVIMFSINNTNQQMGLCGDSSGFTVTIADVTFHFLILFNWI